MEGLSRSDEALLLALYPSLRRFAAVVRPPEVDPDDLLHDAIVRVLARRPLGELDAPSAYLRRTILHLAANDRRRRGRWRRARARVVGGTAAGDTDRYPSDTADLLRLPPRARAVLYLSAVEGYTFSEIADLLDCTEVAARKTASRARRRLAVALLEEAAR